MGGGSVTAVQYDVKTGVSRLCKSCVSLEAGRSTYDSKLSIADGGIVSSKEVYVEADKGVPYRSCRRAESRNLG